ncbi:MAG: EutN/CcmL family microcompartment protein [Chloroflexi bacterium]|jgi:microcompartment protein CcmK/EutM|nr:EutN/CcmL family microcompartment protein [Chloroflexota bacterium]
MKLARVVGNVVSTINAPLFEDRTLLLCDLVDPAGAPAGGYMIAVDTVGAGPGETVLLIDEGSSARQILGLARGPVRTLVVGIVDDVTVAPGEGARGQGAPGQGAPSGAGRADGTAADGAAADPAASATSAARPASPRAAPRSGRGRRSPGRSASS